MIGVKSIMILAKQVSIYKICADEQEAFLLLRSLSLKFLMLVRDIQLLPYARFSRVMSAARQVSICQWRAVVRQDHHYYKVSPRMYEVWL